MALMNRIPWTLGISLPSRFKLIREATFFLREKVVSHSPGIEEDYYY